MRLESRNGQARKPDEIGNAHHLDRPPPKAVALEMRGVSRYGRVAFGSVEQFGKEFHDARVGAHGGKRRQVFTLPGSQQKSRYAQHGEWQQDFSWERAQLIENEIVSVVHWFNERDACVTAIHL